MELLPTTVFYDLRTGEDALNPMERYVIGEVIDAKPGRFFATQDDDPLLPEAWEVERDARDLAFATVHVEVRPSTWITPAGVEPSPPDVVTLGLVVSTSEVDRLAGELAEFGVIATPLFSGATPFAYDPAIFAIPLESSLLAVLGDDSSLQFPFAVDWVRRELGVFDGAIREADVLRAGGEQARVDVVMVGPVAVRPDDVDGLQKRGIDPASLEPASE